jgi:hypothetical protein
MVIYFGQELVSLLYPQSGETNGFAMFNSQLFTPANCLALLCRLRKGVPMLKMKQFGENGTYVFCDWYFVSTGGSVIWTGYVNFAFRLPRRKQPYIIDNYISLKSYA